MKRYEEKLSLLGGPRLINSQFEKYNSIGKEEVKAAEKVVKSGRLSEFLGSWDEKFYGGNYVQKFERYCEEYFDVKHAVTVNSWTSGLICAVGALGLNPGDEVITTPWSMCATATSILHWNLIPVFADIDPKTFNIDPESVRERITPYTKAIMAADIFGQSCNIDKLMTIAKEYNLKVITDTAQSPGSFNGARKTGTIADIGGYSLNCHKHIHTGEGGIIVTNNDLLYERLQLIRNHGEAVVEARGINDINNIIGYNFRLGEIEAAIGIEQLHKLDKFVQSRQDVANKLSQDLNKLDGLTIPYIENYNTHSYYVYPLKIDVDYLGVSREKILLALKAEGLEGLYPGYVLIHQLPMYQKKMAYGSNGFPWSSDICKREVSYAKGICPIAEELHSKTFLGFGICLYKLNDLEIELVIDAFRKVWNNLKALKETST